MLLSFIFSIRVPSMGVVGLMTSLDCTTSSYSRKIVQGYTLVFSKLTWPLLSLNSHIVPRVSAVTSCDRAATSVTADCFVYAVYFFLLSLLPLRSTVATLQSALDVRQRLELGNKLPGSHTVAQKAVLITAIMGLIFALLPTLQQLTKVLYFRSEYFL
jgi:hypothetical protein